MSVTGSQTAAGEQLLVHDLATGAPLGSVERTPPEHV